MAHVAEYLTAALATYLVHSSLILITAVVLDRALGHHRAGLRLALWRAALLGPILTVLMQGALVSRPLGGTLQLVGSRAASTVDPPSTSALDESPLFETASALRHSPPASSGELLPQHIAPVRVSWPTVVAVFWGLGMLVAGARLALAAWRLRRLMRDRKFRPSGRTARRLASALGIRTPQLSTSHRLSIPFAVGLSRPEICLPDRVATDLDRSQLEAVLAHEMAHLAARDPLWLAAYRLLQCALFVQPLNHLALRRLIDTSELCADARAVALTGDRRELARSLVEVASWALSNHHTLPVAAAANRSSSLGRRVALLLDGHTEYTMSKPALAAICSLIAFSVIALPSVTGSAVMAEHDLEAVAAVAAVAPAPEAAPAPPQVPARPEPATAPAPEAAPEPPTEPAPPAPTLDHEYVELTAQRLEQLRLELEMLEDEQRSLLEHNDLDPAAQAKLDEERARCRAEMTALQHELQEHLSRARDLARAAAAERRETARRAETEERRVAAEARAAERSRERSGEARARELEARARAEELRRQEVERTRQRWTVAHEEALEKRLQELEARERALQLREDELQARERELARREGEKTE